MHAIPVRRINVFQFGRISQREFKEARLRSDTVQTGRIQPGVSVGPEKSCPESIDDYDNGVLFVLHLDAIAAAKSTRLEHTEWLWLTSEAALLAGRSHDDRRGGSRQHRVRLRFALIGTMYHDCQKVPTGPVLGTSDRPAAWQKKWKKETSLLEWTKPLERIRE